MEALVRQYEGPVFNAALRLTGDPDDAADVVQSTFTKVFDRLNSFDTSRRFFSWIYRIALNEATNALRSRRPAETLTDDRASTQPGPAALAETGQRARAVQSALARLGPDYRAAITLRYFVGCSYAEMADVLDIPQKTVKSRLFTARRQLQEILERDGVTP